jgi:hypothetical protein
MPRPSLDVTRAEINLYTKDKATMMKHYGPGWTAMVRALVQNHCRMIRANVKPRTVGDLGNE